MSVERREGDGEVFGGWMDPRGIGPTILCRARRLARALGNQIHGDAATEDERRAGQAHPA